MKKPYLLGLPLAASLLASTAWAADYRLAYSKAEGLEVFVPNHSEQNWCALPLTLHLKSDASISLDAIQTISPKLGALLGAQCPQAQEFSWVAYHKDGKQFAKGTASAAQQWEPAFSETAVTPPAPEPEVVNEGTAPEAPASTTEPVKPEPTHVTEPSTASAASEAESQSKPDAATPTVSQTEQPRSMVSVNGWQVSPEQLSQNDWTFFDTFSDQNDCKVLGYVNAGGATQADFAVQSHGEVRCSPQGFLEGKGSIELLRSDGKSLGRTADLHFTNGVGRKHETELPPVVSHDDQAVWLYAGDDPATQSVFLLKAPLVTNYGLSFVDNQAFELIVVHENPNSFLNVKELRAMLDAGLAAAEPWVDVQSRLRILAFNDFEKGAKAHTQGWNIEEAQPHFQYQIDAVYPSSFWSGRQKDGKWTYDLNRATNYAYSRVMAAREKAARERAERIRQQQALLDDYQQLQQRFERTEQPYTLLAEQFRTLGYSPLRGGDYVNAIVRASRDAATPINERSGRTVGFPVHVHKITKEGAMVNEPFELTILDGEVEEKGWYLMQGTLVLDPTQVDAAGLPTHYLREASLHACQEALCTDLANPLSIFRMQHELPNWTPEQAQAIINDVEQKGN
ncbi:MAG TPA: hypothetical protein H9906_04315 [Candidatus Paenalcaligenes intestinipullorum]|uniref:Uncharacterized protein n=1 Tax=Candidatus Paenalcaligenes intestinipullorum TaxID=2838718 RepID=A0A9D2U9G8_9BURK|nr:hypothetical protein [Candidatus Paenalcaligenes intestinipullorum]